MKPFPVGKLCTALLENGELEYPDVKHAVDLRNLNVKPEFMFQTQTQQSLVLNGVPST